MQAVQIHGRMLAIWSAQRDGLPVLFGRRDAPTAANFADPAASFTPEEAARYWQEQLNLPQNVVDSFLQTVATSDLATVTLEYARVLLQTISDLFAKALSEGWTLAEFRRQFGKTIPNASRAEVETLYRTGLSREYGAQRLDLIRGAARDHAVHSMARNPG